VRFSAAEPHHVTVVTSQTACSNVIVSTASLWRGH